MKPENGHFLLLLARRIETSVNPVMVALLDVEEKMDENCLWRSGLLEWARVVRKPGEPTPEERSVHEGTHLRFRDRCPHCVSCRASDPAHRGGRTADGADRLPVRFGVDERGDQRRKGRHSWADGHHHHGNLFVEGAQSLPRSARRALSPTWQRSSWVSLRPVVSDQELWC